LIQYLKHTEIDKSRWDECIHNSPNGLIYAYSWYLDAVCPGWEALTENDYSSVMPLPMGKKYGYTYTYPPPFVQQLGLFSLHTIPEEKTSAFMAAIPPHFRYIEMHLNEKNSFHSPSFEIKEHVTYTLDINRSYPEIALSYSSQTKRNLKKAMASSLTIVQSTQAEKIIKLFSGNRGMELELPVAFYTVLRQLGKVLSSKGLIEYRGVNDKNNTMCAGAFFIRSKGRDIFLFSGANKNAYDSHAMTLLINSYIEERAGSLAIFDFEGSMDADLARFYSGFGSTKINFPVLRKNNLPAPVKWIKDIQYKRRAGN
jgi:hypothetical protein